MGTIIRFSAPARTARKRKVTVDKSQSATVVILPVIRIERYTDKPLIPRPGRSQRRRKRRASRT
jgi:hypothetical protein